MTNTNYCLLVEVSHVPLVIRSLCDVFECSLLAKTRVAKGDTTINFNRRSSLMPLWAGRALIGQVTVTFSRLSVHVATVLSIRFLICKRHYLMCAGFFFFFFFSRQPLPACTD